VTGAGDASVENTRRAQHQAEHRVASVAPAEGADAIAVDIGQALQEACARDLVLDLDAAHVVVEPASARRPWRRRRDCRARKRQSRRTRYSRKSTDQAL